MVVLIVDDAVAHSLAATIRALRPSWVPLAVATVEELDVILGGIAVDVTVVDLHLRGSLPEQTLAVLDLPRKQTMRVLVVSGDPHALHAARERGHRCELKPISGDALVAAIEEVARA